MRDYRGFAKPFPVADATPVAVTDARVADEDLVKGTLPHATEVSPVDPPPLVFNVTTITSPPVPMTSPHILFAVWQDANRQALSGVSIDDQWRMFAYTMRRLTADDVSALHKKLPPHDEPQTTWLHNAECQQMSRIFDTEAPQHDIPLLLFAMVQQFLTKIGLAQYESRTLTLGRDGFDEEMQRTFSRMIRILTSPPTKYDALLASFVPFAFTVNRENFSAHLQRILDVVNAAIERTDDEEWTKLLMECGSGAAALNQ